MEGGEGEEVSQTLPDDLVERIVAMVPFPSIFKARCLSKAWLARFSPIAAVEGEGKKLLAASFQKEVSKRSYSWESFSPVFIGRGDFVGYNPAAQSWRGLPSLSFLPETVSVGSLNRFLARSYMQIEGSLLYGFARPVTGSRSYELHVANILTGTWKQLPAHSEIHTYASYPICYNLVIDPSAEKYKLILCNNLVIDPSAEKQSAALEQDEGGHCSVRTYDSKSEAWSSKDFVVSGDFTVGPSTAAYLDGVLYMVAVNNPQNLLAINAEEGAVRELRLAFDDVIEIVSVNLVVCKVNWLMIVSKGLYPETLQVLKIDLESLRLVQLARGPPAALNVGKIIGQPVGDGSCIFFRVEDCGSRVLVYNVDEDEWSCFPVPAAPNAEVQYKWIASSFKPGLSPFVAV